MVNPLLDLETAVPEPHDDGSIPAAEDRPSASPSSRTPGRRVLIVDDEEAILASLRRLLRREPYDLVTTNSGPEALRIMGEQPAQVVISDYRMPGMTGTDLLREVQARWPDAVRIVLSGYSEVKALIAAINQGAIYKFISKPWNDEELRGNVRQALEQYELAAENRRLTRELAEQNEQLRKANELLDQRAADAAVGLASVHGLLEVLGVGVLTLDESQLIVEANELAGELVSTESQGLIGMPAPAALPSPLYQAIFAESAGPQTGSAGRLTHEGRRLQWRLRPVGVEDAPRGAVVTLWEEVL